MLKDVITWPFSYFTYVLTNLHWNISRLKFKFTKQGFEFLTAVVNIRADKYTCTHLNIILWNFKKFSFTTAISKITAGKLKYLNDYWYHTPFRIMQHFKVVDQTILEIKWFSKKINRNKLDNEHGLGLIVTIFWLICHTHQRCLKIFDVSFETPFILFYTVYYIIILWLGLGA